jgi:alpha-beta hydrolase superfamily lysophospholipase
MTILRELVNGYLAVGKSVLLTGHSLGGSLATLLALDIVMHFPNVPVERLELWTFGGAQVADDRFLESALDAAPRLQNFLEQDHRWLRTLIRTPRKALKKATAMSRGGRSQFHRFVSKFDQDELLALLKIQSHQFPHFYS